MNYCQRILFGLTTLIFAVTPFASRADWPEFRGPTGDGHAVVVSDAQSAGLYHAGGPRALSLYQIAQIVNRVGGYDPNLLMGCPRKDAGPIPPRAGNVAMDSAALADALGRDPLDPWPHDLAHVPTHRDWHHERNGFTGSRELLGRVLYRNPRRSDLPV